MDARRKAPRQEPTRPWRENQETQRNVAEMTKRELDKRAQMGNRRKLRELQAAYLTYLIDGSALGHSLPELRSCAFERVRQDVNPSQIFPRVPEHAFTRYDTYVL